MGGKKARGREGRGEEKQKNCLDVLMHLDFTCMNVTLVPASYECFNKYFDGRSDCQNIANAGNTSRKRELGDVYCTNRDNSA